VEVLIEGQEAITRTPSTRRVSAIRSCRPSLVYPVRGRWALANPVTRPVAQRRARAMLDLCAGFVYSQVLFTCVRLRLFDILFKEPLTTAALAERLSLSPEATCRLLDGEKWCDFSRRRSRTDSLKGASPKGRLDQSA
jgi:demethylspheroidene O-methyltransferase